MHRRLLKNLHQTCKNKFLFYSTSQNQNPFKKTLDAFRYDVSSINDTPTYKYPEHADIVIIGGGFIGSSTAYWLKQRAGEGLSVVILDKDLTFKNSQNLHSFNTLTRHFSLPENILLAEYGAEFLRNVKNELGNDVDIQFTPHEYLLLASDAYADKLEKNVQIQKEQGLMNKLLSVESIRAKYPWIDTTDIKLGCISLEKEGSFNSSVLLKGLQRKCKDMGTTFVEAEVVGFEVVKQQDSLVEGVSPGELKRINSIKYRTKNDEEYNLKFAVCVLAAGVETNNIAQLASIGTGEGLLEISLPLEKRQYKVYAINAKDKLKFDTPYIMDTSGLWLRRNGLDNTFICSQIPALKKEGFTEQELYNNVLKPCLLNRLHGYTDADISVLSEEMYDSNTYDDSGILGPHAYYNNLYIAAGFGRYGVQHAPGIGRGIAESIIDSHYVSIDLTRFGFDRLLLSESLVEFNIY
ncbi:FAD-dependent oxidoreductase domain-containing protein 1 [Aricia agestis]|uniref:FAD-dependent oxidoreductase domain-containing protein 1 n=1 Tax=Aricia agestis TaxID=91739 RepID=UPI001C206137|nr:FAD-dependent oxidoreductase domain-containing protein 1 [Aricia agestis]